jgi:hypothetical protein
LGIESRDSRTSYIFEHQINAKPYIFEHPPIAASSNGNNQRIKFVGDSFYSDSTVLNKEVMYTEE